MNAAKHIAHGLPPIGDEASQVLILGSFPSVLSRANSFYYGNPRNRFWDVLSSFFNEKTPKTNDEKEKFCLLHHIALYDVIEECDIFGSKDSSIKNAIPSSLSVLFPKASIQTIILNGRKAEELFEKFGMHSYFPRADVVSMPSTSPANAQFSLSELEMAWHKALRQAFLPR